MRNFRRWVNRVLGTALIASIVVVVGLGILYPFLDWLEALRERHPAVARAGVAFYLFFLLVSSVFVGYKSHRAVAKLLGEDEEL